MFGVVPDYDLDVMAPGQSLFDSTARIIDRFGEGPARIALTSLWFKAIRRRLCVARWRDSTREFRLAHVEAGLRTGHMRNPFPEEMNRLLTTRLTSLHFPATAVGR